jgi:hypothetical protein
MINSNKLKGKIVENGFSIPLFADKIGMDRSTFYRKIKNGGEDFTMKEVNLMIYNLKLANVEAMSIFFPEYVA